MGCNKRKKAFTLTELLVVVLVLGILAGVAVPKFKRVLETRKTTEAENMLAAVRTEQEKRCIMGKNYSTDMSQLEALANASTSKNYTYCLTPSGVEATSKGAQHAYALKILSYKDGSLCCEGACYQLNKNYPNCDELTVTADECTAEVLLPQEPVVSTDTSCDEADKDESPQPQVVNNMECLVARKATCENGAWVYQNLGIMHPTCHCINTCGENETLNELNCTCETTTSADPCDASQKPNYAGARQFDAGDGYCETTGHAECTASGWKRVEDSRTCYCNNPNPSAHPPYEINDYFTEIGSIGAGSDNTIYFEIGSTTIKNARVCATSTRRYCSLEDAAPVWKEDSPQIAGCECVSGYTWKGGTQSQCVKSSSSDNNTSNKVYVRVSKTINSTYDCCGYPNSCANRDRIITQAGFKTDFCANLSAGASCQPGYESCWSNISCGANYGTSHDYTVTGLACEGSSLSGGLGSH